MQTEHRAPLVGQVARKLVDSFTALADEEVFDRGGL